MSRGAYPRETCARPVKAVGLGGRVRGGGLRVTLLPQRREWGRPLGQETRRGLHSARLHYARHGKLPPSQPYPSSQ